MNYYSSLISVLLATTSITATADTKIPLDCNTGASLIRALEHAKPGETIIFTGNCNGPINITQDGLKLQGQGTAVIDGQKQTAVTIRSAQNVSLSNLEVRNGINGILADAQTQVKLTNVTVYDNPVIGILVQNNSGVVFKDVTTRNNGVHGLDAENTSAVTINGTFTAEANGVFGININAGSSFTLNNAQVTAQKNLLGIQLGTGASAFLGDPASSITAANNVSTGLTVVSGAQMVSFGGKINATGNGRNGVSVNSKAGLDLDAASVLESANNGGNGVQLAESSVMTLFNTTAFSGQQGSTTLKTHDNGGNGIAILSDSNLTSVNQVALFSQNNAGTGVLADNGSAITLLNATVSGNATDIALTFGARSDIRKSNIGTIVCDSNVLSRGDVTCPAVP